MHERVVYAQLARGMCESSALLPRSLYIASHTEVVKETSFALFCVKEGLEVKKSVHGFRGRK